MSMFNRVTSKEIKESICDEQTNCKKCPSSSTCEVQFLFQPLAKQMNESFKTEEGE